MAFSLPESGWASSELTGRIQTLVLLSVPVAVKAMSSPLGDKTGGPAESPLRLSVVFSGGSMTVRTDWVLRAGRRSSHPAAAPRMSAAIRTAIQGRCGCFAAAVTVVVVCPAGLAE